VYSALFRGPFTHEVRKETRNHGKRVETDKKCLGESVDAPIEDANREDVLRGDSVL